jgi:AraC-like DNA-binding protein
MLEGNVKCLLGGFGEVWLTAKCINLFYVPGKIYHKALFKPGFYRSFHIDFSPQTFRHLAARYPELNDVLTRLGGHSTEGIQQHTSYITPVVQKIVNEVLYDCPAGEPDLSTFAEIKSKELLLKYLQNTPTDTSSIPLARKELIGQVAKFMETNLDFPFTIRMLATMFTTNETTLKRQFKQYTGQPIYAFLLQKRMEKALNLIENNALPIRTIALQIGYDDFSSFDRAFSHHFGHSPAFYRKK